jgi:hypothetical protein
MTEPTQKHRELAWVAIGASLPPLNEYSKRFLGTGIDDARDDKGAPKSIFPITARFAQALADLEIPLLAEIASLEDTLSYAHLGEEL